MLCKQSYRSFAVLKISLLATAMAASAVAPAFAQTLFGANQLAVTSGDNQSVPQLPVGPGKTPTATFQSLGVHLEGLTARALLIQKRYVHFACDAKVACAFGTDGKSSIDVPFDNSGVASSGPLAVTGTPGSLSVTASLEGLQSAVFRLTAAPEPAHYVGTFTSGAGQSVTLPRPGIVTFTPVTLTVVNFYDGKPVANVPIVWSCVRPAGTAFMCQLNHENPLSVTTTTDAEGKTTLNQENGGSVTFTGVGRFALVAQNPRMESAVVPMIIDVKPPAPPAPSTPTSPSATTLTPPPATLEFTGQQGNHQTLTRTGTAATGGMASFAPISLVVLDKGGKPAAGKPVFFNCHAPTGGSCYIGMTPINGSFALANVVSDAQGVAKLNLRAGNSALAWGTTGVWQIVATSGGAIYVFELTVPK
jgi:hypothetical protein